MGAKRGAALGRNAVKVVLTGTLGMGLGAMPAWAGTSLMADGSPAIEGVAVQAGQSGSSTSRFSYSGSYDGALVARGQSVESSGQTVTSTEKDRNAALAIERGELSITNGTLQKSGDDKSGDACNFYGVNAAALAVNAGSLLKVSNSAITASSVGSNAVFATDSALAFVEDTVISTTANSARGLDATYNGTVIADKVDITTKGSHCAALATDRGGGSVSATNSQLCTAGSGSPLVYSTGIIELDDCTGVATGSQIACLEGLNNILISDSDLSSYRAKGSSGSVNNALMVYRSSSGDADTSAGERARLQVVDSTLSSSLSDGAFFYFTNTRADAIICNSTLNYNSDNALLVKVAGNSSKNWGTPGSNGAGVSLTAIDQKLRGDVEVDAISTLNFSLVNGSVYRGAVRAVANDQGAVASGSSITVNVSSDSTWVVAGDSCLTNLNVQDGGRVVDEDGRLANIVAGGVKVVEGDSPYTITVAGAYADDFSLTSSQVLTEPEVDRAAFDDWAGLSTGYSVFDGGEGTRNVPVSDDELDRRAGSGSSGERGSGSGGGGTSSARPQPQPGDAGGLSSPNGPAQQSSRIASGQMHRLYNPNSGEHFYTGDASEKNYLVSVGWKYEGVGWNAPASSSTPVYRLYNPNAGEHHYTASASERDALRRAGWNYEGIGWYSDDSKTTPLYRQYNPNQYACNHNYTTSKAENDYLVSLGWRYEGVAWYGA